MNETQMRKQNGYINIDLGAMFTGLIIVGTVIGAILAWLIPLLWGFDQTFYS